MAIQKKALFTFLSCFIIISVCGQQTVKKKNVSKSPAFIENYNVLKDSEEIKYGLYKKTFGKFSISGEFDHNSKVGLWKFESNGKVVQTFNYSTNEVWSLNAETLSDKFWIFNNDIYESVKPDLPPMFMCGNQAFYYHVGMLLRYPAEARRFGVEGRVFVSAIITKEGLLKEAKVEKGVGAGLDEEALRIVKSIPQDWIPGRVNGETVDLKIIIPIIFKLG